MCIRPRRRSGNIYLVVSVTLHLLVVLIFGLSGLRFRKPGVSGPAAGEVDHYAFHVIEVPDDVPVEQPAEHTSLVSDRAARAADMTLEDTEVQADPHSEGDTDIRELKEAGLDLALDGTETRADDPDRRETLKTLEDGDLAGEMSSEQVGEYAIDEADGNRAGSPGRAVRFRNLLSEAGRKGGLSFNTYDWDFAPYMLAMKRAIQSHLFPPYAFTHMGLVSGDNIVRFTVLPDGRIRGLQILDSDVHFSLDRTSVRAIESSVPFLPLPRDFPEEYLEVTAHFSYVVHGRD